MAYSASALSFMLENLGKPVIFTGAAIPLSGVCCCCDFAALIPYVFYFCLVCRGVQ